MTRVFTALLVVGALAALAGCSTRGRKEAADTGPATVVSGRPAAGTAEESGESGPIEEDPFGPGRMPPLPESTESGPSGLDLDGGESGSGESREPAPQSVDDADLSTPVYPNATLAEEPAVARDSETTVVSTHVFQSADPHAVVADWYEAELGDEWTQPEIEAALGGGPVASFRRGGQGDSSATVTITVRDGKTRIAIRESAPRED